MATKTQTPSSAINKDVVRSAFGLLLSQNAMNLATTLNTIRGKSNTDELHKKAWGTVNSIWKNYGGSPQNLVTYIDAGKRKPAKQVKALSSSADGTQEDSKLNTALNNALSLFLAVKDAISGVPEAKDIQDPTDKPSTKILGMSLMTFGLVTLGTLVVLGTATVFIIRAKNK